MRVEREPITELNRAFSSPAASPRAWSEVVQVLSAAEIFWLSTVRADGRPHVTPLPAVWVDGVLHFCVGDQEQKSKNLETNPRCALTTGSNQLRSGLDVVVEGDAERISDETRLRRLARLWKSKLHWPFEVQGGAFRDAAGRRGLVFGLRPTKVLAFGKGEPFSQTRYTFVD